MISCLPDDLMAEATCFECGLTDMERGAIMVYLLAVIAGGSTDPQELLAEAKCFTCLTSETRDSVIAYLLCQIVNK